MRSSLSCIGVIASSSMWILQVSRWQGHEGGAVTDDIKELKMAIIQSLKYKVASLDDDKWMFEAEDDVDDQA